MSSQLGLLNVIWRPSHGVILYLGNRDERARCERQERRKRRRTTEGETTTNKCANSLRLPSTPFHSITIIPVEIPVGCPSKSTYKITEEALTFSTAAPKWNVKRTHHLSPPTQTEDDTPILSCLEAISLSSPPPTPMSLIAHSPPPAGCTTFSSR